MDVENTENLANVTKNSISTQMFGKIHLKSSVLTLIYIISYFIVKFTPFLLIMLFVKVKCVHATLHL